MALIECPECSRSVSSTIDACIHCGYRLKTPVNRDTYPSVIEDSKPANIPKEKKQSSLRSIEGLDSAVYPLVRFVLFRPAYLVSVLGLFTLAIWFMVWTGQLLQPQCSALYDLGDQVAATSQYGHLLGYACMPDFSGTILGSVQTITDEAIGSLKLPVPPLFLGIVCELIGIVGIGLAALSFRKLLAQFRAKSKPDTLGKLRELFSSRPVAAISLLGVSIASIAIMVWTFPLLGPRCAFLLPINGPQGSLLEPFGLTHYFDYVCMPLDPSLANLSKTGLPAFLIGAFIQIICLALLISSLIDKRSLLRKSIRKNPQAKTKPNKNLETPNGKESKNLTYWLRNHKLWWAVAGLIWVIVAIVASLTFVRPWASSQTPSVWPSVSPTDSSTPSVSPTDSSTASVKPSSNSETGKVTNLNSITGLWDRPSNLNESSYPEGLWLNIVKGKSGYVAIFMTNPDKGGSVTIAGMASVFLENGKIIFKWLDWSSESTVAESDGYTLSVDCAAHLHVSPAVYNPDRCNFQGGSSLNLTQNLNSLVALDLEDSAGMALAITRKTAPGWTAKLYDGKMTDTGDNSLVDTFVLMDLGYGQALLWWGDQIPTTSSAETVSYEHMARMGSMSTYLSFSCPAAGSSYAYGYPLSNGSFTSDCNFY